MSLYSILRESQLLLEANVVNIKQPIGSELTVAGYVDQYADYITDPANKTGFAKKLINLLINDESNLYACRELPPEAPDWAKQALEKGDLMVFKPSDQLNDTMQHLSHFIAAAEEDAKQTNDKDLQIFAQRELQSIPKVENLAVLVKKSQEYFARGTRKQKTQSVDGMELVFSASGGFKWYKLVSQDAFAREGKTLQNCIGRNYTAAGTARDNTTILVLKDNGGTSVVGMRIQGTDNIHEMQEVKGKQNQPPVAKYMPPVLEIVNKLHITLSTGAQRDMLNAGYIFHEGLLYTKSDAISKLLTLTPVFDIDSGYVSLASCPSNVLLREIYSVAGGSYQSHHDVAATKYYNIHNSQKQPLVVCNVSNGEKLTDIANMPKLMASVTENDQGISYAVQQGVNGLCDRKKISDISSHVTTKLLTMYKLIINDETDRLVPIQSGGKHIDPKEKLNGILIKEYPLKNIIR